MQAPILQQHRSGALALPPAAKLRIGMGLDNLSGVEKPKGRG
jgi:hypothetical protein